MNSKSMGLLILIVLFGVAFYFLLPYMGSMKESSVKRNLVSSAKVYGDEVKTLWNSDAIYCDDGSGSYKSNIAIPHKVYYVVVGKNDNANVPRYSLNKVDDKYFGYVKVDFSTENPEFSVFLSDGEYSINSDTNYSSLKTTDVEKTKLSFTFDSSYNYCKVDS